VLKRTRPQGQRKNDEKLRFGRPLAGGKGMKITIDAVNKDVTRNVTFATYERIK
jgi:hypothetical protein